MDSPRDSVFSTFAVAEAAFPPPYFICAELENEVFDENAPAAIGVAALLSVTALGMFSKFAWADAHPTGVPVLSSRPGAAYTIYLDFAGFNFNGVWGSNTGQGTPQGATGAINGATGTFTAAQQQIIQNTWAGIAEKYSVFDGINVTTVDPAPAGDTDAQRQAWYDSQPRMMHTILGDDNNWANAGGISYIGVAPNAQTVNGYHTNWVFVNGTGGDTAYHGSVAAGTHENGHAFGLNHQSDYDPITVRMSATIAPTITPGATAPSRQSWA